MPTAEILLGRSPIARVGRAGHRNQVAVIAYHGVADPISFRAQLEAVSRHHNFVSVAGFREWLAGGELPPSPVLVTFDDGDRSVLEHGAPVLEELSIEGVLFVVAGLLDSNEPFWWQEVEALAADGGAEVRHLKTVSDDERRQEILALRETTVREGASSIEQPQLTTSDLRQLIGIGIEIGNHSFDHPCLDRCDDLEAVGQIERAHAALAERNLTPTAFAYPNGNLDQRIEPTLRSLGYDLGFLFDHRHADRNGNRLRLSRLRLDAQASPDRALAILSGVQGAIMRVRRRG